VTPAEILRGAAEMLAAPGAWTQGAWARDAAGRRLMPFEDAATCWCARGALWRCAADGRHGVSYMAAQYALARVVPGRNTLSSIAIWQDAPGRTVEEVRAAMLEAAEHLERAP
jgi:hypothetical protein